LNVSLSSTPNLIALGLVAVALALGLALYLTRYPALSPRKRALLVGVRALTLLALLFASLAPVVRYPSSSRERNRMLILVDHSGSMEVRDGDAAGRTRREVADSAAAAIATELRGRYDVRLAPFDAALGAIGKLDSWKRAGPMRGAGETALGDALREALDRVDPDSLAAMLVLSDGAVNRGEDPERVLGSTVPAFALVTGWASEPPTTGIGGVDVPAEVVTGRPAVMTVTIRHGSLPAVRGVARLSEGGRELGRASFSLDKPGSLTRVPIPFTIGDRGKHFLTVRLDSLPGDRITQNKRRLVAVMARPSKHVVPLLAPSWDWDLRSISRGVEEDTSWTVRRLTPSGTGVAAPGSAARPLAQELREVDAAVIRYDARALTPERSASVLDFIARGGGVLFWTDPVTQPPPDGALPRALGLTWRDFEAPASSGGIELTAAGRSSEIALLGGDAASAGATWHALPPVPVPVVLTSGGPLAPLLVARYGTETIPVLLAGRIGLGRVAVLNASGVYRWGLTASGLSGGAGIEPTFFGGLATWLSQSADDRPVRIVAPDITPAARPIPVRLALAAPAMAPGARATVRPDGPESRAVTLVPSPQGDFAGSMTLPEGVYVLHGKVERGGRVLGTDSIRVAVGEQGVEFETLQADPAALGRLASRSGGESAPIGHPDRVLARLRSPDIAKARMVELDLFHNVWLFLALVLGACGEWILRKRFHLL
jgi:type II secretory pathway component PulM